MIKKKPFRKYNLDEEGKKQDIVSVRLNPEERAILNKYKALFDVKSDGKMLKMGFIIGSNVLHRDFPPKILRYLIKGDRIKLSDYEDIDKKL